MTYSYSKIAVVVFFAATNVAHAEESTTTQKAPLQMSSTTTSGVIKKYGIVPYRPSGAPAGTNRTATPSVTPTCHSPKVSYFGGPLVSNAQIVPVFWSNAVNSEVILSMSQFYSDAAVSNWFDMLSEYATPSGYTNQSIGRGTSLQGVTLTPSTCASSSKCNLTDAQLQNELSAQITAGQLPTPTLDGAGNPNTIYMVHFPANITLTGPDGTSTSCVQFCAYHNTGFFNSQPLLYGAVMDEYTSQYKTGCGDGATSLENTTSTASHELAEAVTDADIGLDTQSGYANPAAWGDNVCGEVADICDNSGAGSTITVEGRSWIVQQLWSNATGACVGTALAPKYTLSPPASASPGMPITFTLTVNNPVAPKAVDIAYAGVVHVTSSDPNATLPDDFVFVPNDQGVASIGITLNTVGSQTITATDTLNGTITATSTSITVSQAATTTTLSTVCPTTFVADQSIDLTATIKGFAPTGAVNFQDDTASLCPNAGVSSNVATCQTPTLALQGNGTSFVYNLTASYSGDGSNLSSSSTALTVTVLDPNDVVFRGSFEAAIAGCPSE